MENRYFLAAEFTYFPALSLMIRLRVGLVITNQCQIWERDVIRIPMFYAENRFVLSRIWSWNAGLVQPAVVLGFQQDMRHAWALQTSDVIAACSDDRCWRQVPESQQGKRNLEIARNPHAEPK